MPKILELTGQTFGRLTVLKRAEPDGRAGSLWLCRCSCGKEFVTRAGSLRQGHSKSCGCGMGQNLKGERFGRLMVTGNFVKRGASRYWDCTCDCGKQTSVKSGHLTSNATRSCGCLIGDVAAVNFRTHGRSKTPEYRAWEQLRRRCMDPKCPQYPNYGGRGIAVSSRWNRFEAFFEDMGPRPIGGSVDRIDVNGNYTPENCRWATMKQQQRNRRNNRRWEMDGQSLTVGEWAEISGVNWKSLKTRLYGGWSVRDAITTPF